MMADTKNLHPINPNYYWNGSEYKPVTLATSNSDSGSYNISNLHNNIKPELFIFLGAIFLFVLVLLLWMRYSDDPSKVMTDKPMSDGEINVPDNSALTQSGDQASSGRFGPIIISVAFTLTFLFLRSMFKSMGANPMEAVVASVITVFVILAGFFFCKSIWEYNKSNNFAGRFIHSKIGRFWLALSASWLMCLTVFIVSFEPFGSYIYPSEWQTIYKLVAIPPLLSLAVILIFIFTMAQNRNTNL